MKHYRRVFCFIAVIALCITMGLSAQNKTTSLYPRAGYIVGISDDVVTVEDSVRFLWEFVGAEDYCLDDMVIMTMNDRGTTETILDDEIVEVRYSGFYR